MRKIEINTHKELKHFVKKNRADIVGINNVGFNERYPMLTLSNKHSNYYDASISDTRILSAPFTVLIK